MENQGDAIMKLSFKIWFVITLMFILILTVFVSAGAETDSNDSNLANEHGRAETVMEKSDSIFKIQYDGGEYVLISENGDELLRGDLQRLISSADARSNIFFDSIVYEGNLILDKPLALSGYLELQGGSVSVNVDTAFYELSLSLNDGSVKIKDATLTVSGAKIISSKASAITLDYSSKSHLDFKNGEIIQGSLEPAILLKMGSADISGGSVISSYSCAIENYGTLNVSSDPTVSGYNYDIITNHPLWLSSSSNTFVGEVDVQYKSLFNEGTLSTVFYGASLDSLNTVTLYDEVGEEFELCYFEESEYTEDRNILAVYLPFRVKFYIDGELFEEIECLDGDVISAPKEASKEGFSFVGWFAESMNGYLYSFGTPVRSDISLYGKYSLVSPNFSISSLDFVYDGDKRILGFENLFHPLMEQGGSFSFDWYKDGEALEISSPELKLSEVSDSGEYYCRLIFSYGGSFVTVDSLPVTVTVSPKILDAPQLLSKEYTSNHLIADIPESPLYSITNEGGVSVGSYPVFLTLNDSENYRWNNSSGAQLELSFEIVKAANSFIAAPTVKDGYTGVPLSLSGNSRFGSPVFYFSESITGEWSENAPTAAGVYYFIAVVEETDDYYRLESEPLTFVLTEDSVLGIRINTPPAKNQYIAFESLDLSGISVYATYSSGRILSVDPNQLSVVYQNGEHLLVGDSSAMICYSGFSVPFAVSVSKASYDVSAIGFSDESVVFDGKRKTITPYGEIIGADGIPLSFKTYGGGISAGIYEVELRFTVSSPNYEEPAPIIAMLTVTPMELTVEYGNTVFVYDKTLKIPTAEIITVEGMKLALSVLGGATDAGIYTGRAIFDNPDYLLINPEISFEIKKADIDLSGVVWNCDSFTYTGEVFSVNLQGLPDYVTLIGYTNSSFSEAGSYKTVASIYYDDKNYNAPPQIYHNWEILPAEYDLSGIEILDVSAEYDGEIHYPQISGSMPVGADGIMLEFNITEGAVNVSETPIRVRIEFITASTNYITPEPVYAYVEILPKPVTAIWGELTFVYNGEPIVPEATLSECGVTVIGAQTNAGEYQAFAVADNPNYTIENATVTFVISKVVNSWVEYPSVSNIFCGRLTAPEAEALFGTVEYRYFADEALTVELQSFNDAGTYYMIAFVAESDNYLSITSDAVAFEIIAITPIELTVELCGYEAVAMKKIAAGSFNVFCRNNDESIELVSWDDISIIYQNGKCPTVNDTYITVEAFGVSAQVEITVNKGYYDFSSVFWQGTEHIYDGEIKSAYLEGLPEGVQVLSYELNSATDAGYYKLSAVLDFDSENYHAPILPEAYLVIKKCEFPLPEIQDIIYDGNLHSPSIEKSEIYDIFATEGNLAGDYKVTLVIKNSNYTFAGGDTAEIYYSILPRDLVIQIKDSNSYEIIEGSIVDGDIFDVEFYKENGYINLKHSNPNYSVTVLPLAESGANDVLWLWFVVFLASLLFAMATFAVFTKRDKLLLLLSGAGNTHKTEEKYEPVEITENCLLVTDEAHASALISDVSAKSLIRHTAKKVKTRGDKRVAVNIDTISNSFAYGDTVDINSMKEKGIIPEDSAYVKVLARGVIDKPLFICANSFSLSAVKMIALTGGKAFEVKTERIR